MGIPLYFFKFLVISFVILVIIAGITVTWLGTISIRLQAAEMMAQENAILKQQLKEVGSLQEELSKIQEREKALNALTQAFLDDPDSSQIQEIQESSSGIFDEKARAKFLSEVLSVRRTQLAHSNLSKEISHIPFLSSPIRGEDALSFLLDAPGPDRERTVFCRAGSTIRSPADGIVLESGWTPRRGLRIRLALPEGLEATFSDLGELEVQAGDLVRRGEIIGKSRLQGGESSSRFRMTLSIHELAIDPWFAMMR
ncbi:MAG TPA: M23 family metallopeptidase [Fibrobacteria bacterium]|nr:M23 family metallopeptidase [Fibrobacteria bacterium]HOX50118.1 M23 family metallopeptidase [Fibrobacteria bacterium]